MINELIHDAISLNNEGVSYLLSGNVKTGVMTLKNSLVTFQHVLELITSAEYAADADPSSKPDVVAERFKIRRGAQSRCYHSEVLLPKGPKTSVDHQFVYGKAMKINPENIDEREEISNRVHIYSACVVLNLALVYHPASSGGKHMTSLLQKAVELYRMVISILQGHGCAHDTEPNETAILVKAVALNNQCSIQLVLENQDEAREGFQDLYEFIGSNEAVCRPLFTSEEWKGLLMNAASVPYPFAGAPAA